MREFYNPFDGVFSDSTRVFENRREYNEYISDMLNRPLVNLINLKPVRRSQPAYSKEPLAKPGEATKIMSVVEKTLRDLDYVYRSMFPNFSFRFVDANNKIMDLYDFPEFKEKKSIAPFLSFPKASISTNYLYSHATALKVEYDEKKSEERELAFQSMKRGDNQKLEEYHQYLSTLGMIRLHISPKFKRNFKSWLQSRSRREDVFPVEAWRLEVAGDTPKIEHFLQTYKKNLEKVLAET